MSYNPYGQFNADIYVKKNSRTEDVIDGIVDIISQFMNVSDIQIIDNGKYIEIWGRRQDIFHPKTDIIRDVREAYDKIDLLYGNDISSGFIEFFLLEEPDAYFGWH